MKYVFLLTRDSQFQDIETSLDPMSDVKLSERWCRYFLQQSATRTLIGVTQVPIGMDVDDAFPPFHAENFSEGDRDSLAEAIGAGGVLIAESSFEQPSLLAYRLDDPNYWFGREATLKYLGVIDFKLAC